MKLESLMRILPLTRSSRRLQLASSDIPSDYQMCDLLHTMSCVIVYIEMVPDTRLRSVERTQSEHESTLRATKSQRTGPFNYPLCGYSMFLVIVVLEFELVHSYRHLLR